MMIVVFGVFGVFGALALVAWMSGLVEQRENIKKIEQRHLQDKRSKWVDAELVIASYIATNIKIRYNKTLLDELAYVIGRPTSALVRKVNRLRGVMTNKSPYATVADRQHILDMKAKTAEQGELMFFDALIEMSGDVDITHLVPNNTLVVN